jgi:uncharacterized RDD family membrane protein YckC
MERIDPRRPTHTEDRVAAPLAPDDRRLRDGFFEEMTRLFGGVIRGERWVLRLGPIVLFRFGEPRALDGGWSWPIAGGLLVARPAGSLALSWHDGQLVSTVDGYQPRLPRPLYRLTQLPLHPMVTRLVLLRLRGRSPSPGVPAGPARRAAAAGIDLAFCAALALSVRRRRMGTFAVIAATYHVGCWATTGRTLGARLLGQRLVAVDGSPPSGVQAVVRLLTLPLSVPRLRAVHDELAGTDVIEGGWRAGARG